EELELEDKDFKVRLKKEGASPPPAPAAGAQALAGATAGEAPVPAAETPAGGFTIVSPIVGTFYRAPTPDGEPFVEIGDPVEPETVICIVEAMKVMNEVKAEVRGSLEKAFVENGSAVEYGQPLFLVATS
ncbi:MAG: acetyl-CoA carboxylase biotin carboxyl carrier protein, partial [Planctomycetota bacterium]